MSKLWHLCAGPVTASSHQFFQDHDLNLNRAGVTCRPLSLGRHLSELHAATLASGVDGGLGEIEQMVKMRSLGSDRLEFGTVKAGMVPILAHGFRSKLSML